MTLPPMVDCIVGTVVINSDVTLIAAGVADVAGVIDLKNPLNCKTKYVSFVFLLFVFVFVFVLYCQFNG